LVIKSTGSFFKEKSILFNNSFFQSNLTNCQLPNAINIDIKKNTKIENKSLFLKVNY